jgi:hypothetical protein
MRLVLREYLSMVKESGELDVMVPDLLAAMGLDPLSRPATGPRQFGVDVPAVGQDASDGNRVKLFLFTIKRGNITRAVWNTGLQAVRPSLDEILDVYLQTHVRPEHVALPKKIVLVTGGELGQDVEPDWTAYIRANRTRYPQYGEVEFDFWGGDALSGLMDRYLFDEYLFPERAQKRLRKTIALADQNEDDPRQFYEFVRELLLDRGIRIDNTSGARREREKVFTLLELSLHIVFRWCEEAGNIRPAMLAAERTVLMSWKWIVDSNLTDCAITVGRFSRLLRLHRDIGGAFSEKLRAHSTIQDSLFGYGGDQVEYPTRTFEVIGLVALATIGHVYSSVRADNTSDAEQLYSRAQDLSEILEGLIRNNPGALTPRFDSHVIDVGLGLLATTLAGSAGFPMWWIEALSTRIVLATRMGRSYPVSTDSYEDLVELWEGTGKPKETLLNLSTLIPIIAEWMAVYAMKDAYQDFSRAIREDLPHTNFQMWFPDASTEEVLYTENAGYSSGATLSSIELPQSLESMQERITRIAEARSPWDELSCLRHERTELALVASRHFRMPLIPALWQDAVTTTEDVHG